MYCLWGCAILVRRLYFHTYCTKNQYNLSRPKWKTQASLKTKRYIETGILCYQQHSVMKNYYNLLLFRTCYAQLTFRDTKECLRNIGMLTKPVVKALCLLWIQKLFKLTFVMWPSKFENLYNYLDIQIFFNNINFLQVIVQNLN